MYDSGETSEGGWFDQACLVAKTTNMVLQVRQSILALAATAILVGCGGSSSDPVLPPVDESQLPEVVLSDSAQAQFLLLSGEGRRRATIGSQIVTLGRIQVVNDPFDFAPVQQQGSGGNARVNLDGFSINDIRFNYTLTGSDLFKDFSEFPLEVNRVDEVTATVPRPLFTGPTFRVTPSLDIQARFFRGRQSTVNVLLNNSILGVDGEFFFDRDIFEEFNYNPETGSMVSFLSDYVTFDLAALPASVRPTLQNGSTARWVMFSGDNIALASAFNTPGAFEQVIANVDDVGVFRQPEIIAGSSTEGTYFVLEPDPREIADPTNTITATQGIWRNWFDVIRNVQSYAVIVFPNSRGSNEFQTVAFSINASNSITGFLFGTTVVNGETGTITLYTANQIGNPTTPAATGTIGNLVLESGMPRQGAFTLNASPSGVNIPVSGQFILFAR